MTLGRGDATDAVLYLIDVNQRRFVAQAFAKGMLSAFGHNPRFVIRAFDGAVEFDPAAPNDASVWIMAPAGSLDLMDDVSEKDRREIERVTREKVLAADRYPQITFRSASVAMCQTAAGRYEARIVGALTLRGVTRECAIDAKVAFEGDDIRATGGFSLRQSDFNIRPISVAGGLLKIKDEVKLSFDILARPLRA